MQNPNPLDSRDLPTLFDITQALYEASNGSRNPRDYIDDITLGRGYGKVTGIRDRQFIGINHRHTATNLPPNLDHNGHCFFVRPNLNLSRTNAIRMRQLARLVNNNPLSIEYWARMTLDPKLSTEERLSSPLVDNENPFIPLLSNTLRTLTNVPSLVAGVHTTERGIAKEVFSMIDDNVINYDAYSVTASFRNMNGNPLLILFYSWILAASGQYLGKIAPRWLDRMQRRMNYTSRIYRLVMDHTQTYVTNIWAPIYCFPISIETGSTFRYNIEDPYNMENDNIDVTFQCVGSVFNDDLLIQQFNTLQGMANPGMTDAMRKSHMVKIDKDEAVVLNYFGYPRINPETTELEWWVPKEIYHGASEKIKEQLRMKDKPKAEADAPGQREYSEIANKVKFT